MHMFYSVIIGIYQFAANLLSYIPTKYYWNRSTSDLIIAKSKRVNFFWNTVYIYIEKIVFLHFGNRQTDKQTNSTDALSRSRCRERQLNYTYDITVQ